MTKATKPGHYSVRKGRGYWIPTAAMKTAGFRLISCGPDGPEARKCAREAEAAYQRWREQGDSKPNPFPAGSLGSFWHHLHSTELWRRKKKRTRQEYEYVWDKYIDPKFGKRRIDQITPVDCEKLHVDIEEKYGQHERYKAMKILRALFSAAIKYRVLGQSPANTIPNSAPKGRSAVWRAEEVLKLVEDAWDLGLHGMSFAISVGWDTMLSPVDVRLLLRNEWHNDGHGAFIAIDRQKTGRPVLAPVSPQTSDLLERYLANLGFEIEAGERLVRMQTGVVYRTKDTFAKDFRKARAVSFPEDDRKFLDLRRSGNLEAWVGGADRDAMGKALGNRIGDNQFLFETYTPPSLEAARRVVEARDVGRSRLSKKEDPMK